MDRWETKAAEMMQALDLNMTSAAIANAQQFVAEALRQAYEEGRNGDQTSHG